MSKKISTEAVRSEWSYSRDPGPEHRTTEEWWQIRDDALAEFDAWLDQVKADAWDEGLDAAQRAETLRTYTPDNPYRKQEEA